MQQIEHEQIYLDTNIFIAALEGFHRVAVDLFARVEKDWAFALTSEVTRGELLVKPMMTQNEPLIERYQKLFGEDQKLATLPVDSEVIFEAARLSALAGLELLDAVHCATAQVAQCRYIISQDRDLKTYSDIEVLSLEDLEGSYA